MKQCLQYEDAMHYDCAVCDEKDCAFRKEASPFDRSFAIILLFVFIIIISLIIYFLI